jgi:hypothetical protein
MVRAARGLVIVVLGGLLVAAVMATAGPLAAALLAVAVLVLASFLPSRILLTALVVSEYVTRFRIPVAGFRLLPVVACGLEALREGRVPDLLRAMRHPTVRLMGAYVAWTAVISILRSPDPAKSLPVAGWLGLSWLILVVLGGLAPGAAWLQQRVVGGAVAAALVAVALFVAARTIGVTYGLQDEYLTGSKAEYGLAWEANILGSTLAIATFVLVTAPERAIARGTKLLVSPLLLVALLLTLTRGAVAGLVVGGAAWVGLSPHLAWRRLGPALAVSACIVVGLVTISPSTTSPVAEKLSALVDADDGTAFNRVQAWTFALDDLHEVGTSGVVLGLGLNSFGQRHYDPSRPDRELPAYLGNIFLQVLYDTGLVGAGLLIAALLCCWPSSPGNRSRALGLLLVVLTSSAATSAFWFGSTWTLIALAVIGSSPRSEPVVESVDLRDTGALQAAER